MSEKSLNNLLAERRNMIRFDAFIEKGGTIVDDEDENRILAIVPPNAPWEGGMDRWKVEVRDADNRYVWVFVWDPGVIKVDVPKIGWRSGHVKKGD